MSSGCCAPHAWLTSLLWFEPLRKQAGLFGATRRGRQGGRRRVAAQQIPQPAPPRPRPLLPRPLVRPCLASSRPAIERVGGRAHGLPARTEGDPRLHPIPGGASQDHAADGHGLLLLRGPCGVRIQCAPPHRVRACEWRVLHVRCARRCPLHWRIRGHRRYGASYRPLCCLHGLHCFGGGRVGWGFGRGGGSQQPPSHPLAYVLYLPSSAFRLPSSVTPPLSHFFLLSSSPSPSPLPAPILPSHCTCHMHVRLCARAVCARARVRGGRRDLQGASSCPSTPRQ